MANEFEGINNIPGMENFFIEAPTLQYVKIVSQKLLGNSPEIKALGLPLDTVFLSGSNKVLAKPKERFKFVVVYMFNEFTIWKDKKPIAKSNSKTGKWSNGMQILPEHFQWIDGNAPLATEAVNFIILPIINGTINAEDKAVISYGYSNNFKKEAGNKSKLVIGQAIVTNKLAHISQGIYSLGTQECINKKKDVWTDFTAFQYEGKLENPTMLEAASSLYNDVRNIDKASTAAVHEVEIIEETESAESDTPY